MSLRQLVDLIAISARSAGDTLSDFEALCHIRALIKTYDQYQAPRSVTTNVRLDVFEFDVANDWTKKPE